MPIQTHPLHVLKPRSVFEKLLTSNIILPDREAQIPDVVSGALLRNREGLQPSLHILQSEVDGAEEVPPAWWNP